MIQFIQATESEFDIITEACGLSEPITKDDCCIIIQHRDIIGLAVKNYSLHDTGRIDLVIICSDQIDKGSGDKALKSLCRKIKKIVVDTEEIKRALQRKGFVHIGGRFTGERLFKVT